MDISDVEGALVVITVPRTITASTDCIIKTIAPVCLLSIRKHQSCAVGCDYAWMINVTQRTKTGSKEHESLVHSATKLYMPFAITLRGQDSRRETMHAVWRCYYHLAMPGAFELFSLIGYWQQCTR
jgi:hypothetical protein